MNQKTPAVFYTPGVCRSVPQSSVYVMRPSAERRGYLLIHIIHAAVAVAAAALLVFLGGFGDQGVAREQQRGDAGGVLQRGAGDLGGVDDAGFDQVFVLVGRGVVAFVAFAFGDAFADDAAVLAGVVGDRRQRRAAGADDDVVADLLVVRSRPRPASPCGWPAAGRRRRRAGCLLRRPRGWRAGRLRRGPSFPSSRSRSRRRR